MMAESTIPTPPQTPTSTSNPLPEISLECLDSLLETYLELLDEYTTLRTRLSKQLSDGFFSLARANHISTGLGIGRRYGEEGYDERMKAQRRVVYSSEGSRNTRNGKTAEPKRINVLREGKDEDLATPRQTYRVSIQKTRDVAKHEKKSQGGDLQQAEGAEEREQSFTTEPAAAPGSSTSPTRPKASFKGKVTAKPLPSDRDPLNWYGILVPPPLRQTQASFVSAVESSIPSLLNTCAAMGDLETQITHLRIELGLRQADVAGEDFDEGLQAQKRDERTSTVSLQLPKSTEEAASGHVATNSQKRFVQRPCEPRSRTLKVDG